MAKFFSIGGVSSNNSFVIDVVNGVYPDKKTEFKFGRSTNVTAVETVVWDGGSNYIYLESAETLDIVSTSTDDAAGGIGAILMGVWGLDNDHNEIFELVTLTGIVPLTTVNSYLRIFRMMVITSGTNDPVNDANKGTVSATSTDTAVLQARIQINNGQTLMTPYTVPAGKSAFITGMSLSAGQGKQCYFKAKFRNGSTSSNAFSIKYALDLYQTAFTTNLATPLKVPEKTDIVITAQTTSGTIDVAASYGFILIDN